MTKFHSEAIESLYKNSEANAVFPIPPTTGNSELKRSKCAFLLLESRKTSVEWMLCLPKNFYMANEIKLSPFVFMPGVHFTRVDSEIIKLELDEVNNVMFF